MMIAETRLQHALLHEPDRAHLCVAAMYPDDGHHAMPPRILLFWDLLITSARKCSRRDACALTRAGNGEAADRRGGESKSRSR
jgi:hypothetical protein